ncbi:hypothetical protein PWT90_08668 [Aphanocladium album]|nr:hypothetical protein PWT90_08668 [Aphanocladium album]
MTYVLNEELGAGSATSDAPGNMCPPQPWLCYEPDAAIASMHNAPFRENYLTYARPSHACACSSAKPHCPGAMTLLVIADAASCGMLVAQAQRLVATADFPAPMMTHESVLAYNPLVYKISTAVDISEKRSPSKPFVVYEPIVFDGMAPEYRCCGGYDAKAYVARLKKRIRHCESGFLCLCNGQQLAKCLELLANRVGNGPI